MNDQELDRLVARANPFGAETVGKLPTDGAETDLLEEIVNEPRPRKTRPVSVVLAAAAVAGVVAAGAIVLPGRGSSSTPPDQPPVQSRPSPPVQSKPVATVPGKNYQLVMDGWAVTRADEFDATHGEMTFRKGDHRFDVTWYAASEYQTYFLDRSANSSVKIPLLGQTATRFQYAGSTDYATMLPPKGGTFLEIRADLGSEQAYQDALGKLKRVDGNTWYGAMPATVVQPDKVKASVTVMLADIPQPPGLDRGKLNKPATLERYHLGARVAGLVTCGWIGAWDKAVKAGDDKGAKRAADALATSRSWKVLAEMNPDGDYPEVLWEFADTVVKQHRLPEHYQQGLGC